jgi:Domain of unknown function DUF29
MDERITYDDDFYGWSQQQAAVLREMAGRRDLPNALDLEHVAEEIEGVGDEQRNAVQSYIRLIFVHLLKAASVNRPQLRAGWYAEITNFHAEMLGRFSRSMRQEIDIPLLWRRAFRQAALSLQGHGDELRVPSDADCPFDLDDFLHEEFDFEAAVERVLALLPERSEPKKI